MPTISSSKVPSPKSWDEFEEITLSAAKLRWNSTDFYRHGRQGQKQDGVDIWGYDGKRHIGVQCKNTTGELGLAVVETEIANAENSCQNWIISTLSRRPQEMRNFKNQ